ncbi:MAG TPA: ATP-binding protein, partial [Acetobacteraceae bacterium]|nr:ATP-binding protein [Acetobacteraceae bacterium]
RTIRTRPDGTVLEVVSDPIPDGGWVLTYTDFTAERRIRAELERAKEAAEAANNAKSRFLATMSHELRTPLNAVIGFSEAFAADPDPVRGAEYVRSIHEAGHHLLVLIDNILDVARAETLGFQTDEGEIDVAALAESAVRVMRGTAAASNVTLSAELDPSLPRARGDAVRLRQVLLNLLANAVKFTPAGGSVTLAASVERPSGDLVVKVTDTGIGIAPEDIPRAFEPFTQLDSSLSRRYGGSGIGLYLARALAEAQGATLGLESSPGIGTTALLRLPASRLLSSMPV